MTEANERLDSANRRVAHVRRNMLATDAAAPLLVPLMEDVDQLCRAVDDLVAVLRLSLPRDR